MNKYPQELFPTVEKIMKDYPKTRNSDIELYKIVLLKFYGTTDISKIPLTNDVFVSIKRCRQKIQETNPFLGPTKEVQFARQKVEQTFIDFARTY